MNANPTPITASGLSTLALGAAAAFVVLITAAGLRVPLFSNERVALAVLLIVGMAMCTSGIGRVAAAGAWLHPLSIAGMVLGALILIVAGAALLGKPLPLIADARQAVMGVGLLGLAKLGISLAHRLSWQ